MRKPGRFFFTILCFCLLIGSSQTLVPRVYAASSMTASEACAEFIKTVEGFSSRPYYDHKQHTVGYGTKCPTEKYFDYMVNGIPKEEAEELLRETLANVGDTINKKLIDQYNLSLSQHQFDALVSFSFNIGTGWMTYDSTLRNAILRNAPADDLVYAFSLYCTAGGYYTSGLISRRLCEANIYLNGIYSQKPSGDYGYVFYDPNGGSLTYQVQGFICENRSAPAADAVRTGDVFLGWYTDLTGGSKVTELDRTFAGKTLFARWQSSGNAEQEDCPSTVIRVTGDVVNIRKGPGTNYGIAKQVYFNDVLIVSHTTNLSNRKWGKVQDGWICLEYTNYDDVIQGNSNSEPDSNESPSGETTVPDLDPDLLPDSQETVMGTVRVDDLLSIRSGPGTTYARVGYLVNGSKVEILEQKTADAMVWGRIDRGWVSMDYIVADDPQTDNTTEPDPKPDTETAPDQDVTKPGELIQSTAKIGKIIADVLRIRSGPGASYSIVGFYYQNDMIVITDQILVDSAYWGKTDSGWIHMDYVLTGSSDNDSYPTGEAKTVIADCLRVRKEIGTDSRIAALLYYGDTVTVFETKTVNGVVWGKVDRGWICMEYVN